MLTIACVYKPGGGFSDEYVTRLWDGVEEFCKVEHRFVCLSTVEVKGVECVLLKRNNRGYWNKLELFRKGLFDGPVVYLDLDTIIVDDITDICTYPHEFTVGANWKLNAKGQNVINSAFMAWDGREDLSHMDQDIDRSTMGKYEQSFERFGDQGYIQDHLQRPWQNLHRLFPDRFVSYKIHVRRQGKVPKGASIVAFHGKPRPHEVNWSLPC